MTTAVKSRRWYKDKFNIMMIAFIALAIVILYINNESRKADEIQNDNDNQLLVTQNKTLILVNKTAAFVIGNTNVSDSPEGVKEIKNLLSDINQTLSNPNRTLKTEEASRLNQLSK